MCTFVCRYLAVGSVLIVAGPWTADMVGVRGLAARVVVVLAGCAGIAVAWTFAFIQLATTWFVAGKAEALYR